MLRLHHLDCGTLRWTPRPRAIGGPWGVALTGGVTHCVLVEARERLVLVDSGFGLLDVALPWRRLGPKVMLKWAPALRASQTAVRQLQRLGVSSHDVTDIVLTHLHPPQSGGLADFPSARVHVSASELAAATSPGAAGSLGRYRSQHWAHGPSFVAHRPSPEACLGLPSVAPIGSLRDELRMIHLPGHTQGHTGVALRVAGRWLLHAGDSYQSRRELQAPDRSASPLGPMAHGRREGTRREPLQSLASIQRIVSASAGSLSCFCSCDPAELAQAREEAAQR